MGGRVPLDLRFRGPLEAKSFVRGRKIEPPGAPGKVFDLQCASCGHVRRCTRAQERLCNFAEQPARTKSETKPGPKQTPRKANPMPYPGRPQNPPGGGLQAPNPRGPNTPQGSSARAVFRSRGEAPARELDAVIKPTPSHHKAGMERESNLKTRKQGTFTWLPPDLKLTGYLKAV